MRESIAKYYGAKVGAPVDGDGVWNRRELRDKDKDDIHAFLDFCLGHIMTNLVMGATLFAVLGVYAVSAQKALLNFFEHDLKLGKNAPIVLPLIMSLVPIIFGSLEFFVRNCLKKQKDTNEDVSVHTPFPKINPYSRQAATVGILFLFSLQTANGYAAVHPGEMNKVFEEIVKDWHKDPLAMYMGQLLLVALMGKLVDHVPGIIAAGARKVGAGCRFLADKAAACCRDSQAYARVPAEEPSV